MSVRIITMSLASTLCLLIALYCYWRYRKGSQPHKFYFQGFIFLILATLLTLTRRVTDPSHPVYLLGFALLLISVGAGMVSLYRGWRLSRVIRRQGGKATG